MRFSVAFLFGPAWNKSSTSCWRHVKIYFHHFHHKSATVLSETFLTSFQKPGNFLLILIQTKISETQFVHEYELFLWFCNELFLYCQLKSFLSSYSFYKLIPKFLSQACSTDLYFFLFVLFLFFSQDSRYSILNHYR